MEEEQKHKPDVFRVDGRLHVVDEIRNAAGELITQIASPMRVELKFEDIVQLIVGSLMLGVPVALSEEAWNLGATLPASRIYMIAGFTIMLNAFFIKMLFYRDNLPEYRLDFIKRVCAAYIVALLMALLLLAMFDKGLLEDPILAMRRAVIIAFPASFAATTVDYMR